MTPAIVSALPLVTATPPPEAPKTTPRLALKETELLEPSSSKVPPFSVSALVVTVLGTAPKLSSDETTSVPPVICVVPV